MRENTVIKMSVQRMVCTGCGSEANATCDCGVSYVPKAVRAREIREDDPTRSIKSIAREVGTSPANVREAIGRGDDHPPPLEMPDEETWPNAFAKAAGLDRRDEKIGQKNLRSVLLMNSASSVKCAAYEGPVDEEIIGACRRAANAWSELANNLERGSHV